MNFYTLTQAFISIKKKTISTIKYNAIQLASTAEPQLYLLRLLSYFYRCEAVTYWD